MKNIARLFLVSMLSGVFVFAACDDDECIACDSYDVETAIVVKLPRMGSALKDNETKVVNTREEFRKVFPYELSDYQEKLELFDPEIHTLLVGQAYHVHQAILDYTFSRSGTNKFTLQVDVTGMLTVPDNFSYGVIVKKLPAKAKIEFKVEYPEGKLVKD